MSGDLPTRLSEATGADRELDLAIADHFPGVTVPFHNIGRWDAPEWVNPASTHGRYVPFYTASLDAALALVERVAPWAGQDEGWSLIRFEGQGGRSQFEIGNTMGEGATPALAVLSALLATLPQPDPERRDD